MELGQHVWQEIYGEDEQVKILRTSMTKDGWESEKLTGSET